MPTARLQNGSVVDTLRAADGAREAGDLDGAIAAYLSVVEADPSSTYAHYWLATLREQAGELECAREHCDAGLRSDPNQIALLMRKASVARAADDHYMALECYLRSAAIDPGIPGIDALIADRYAFLGEAPTAAAYFERALAMEPDSLALQSNLLFVLNYCDAETREQRFARHREWGRRQEAAVANERRPHVNERSPERRLRIGYVSGDLRNHAVAYFIEPLLRHHDASAYDVHCYDTSTLAEDAVTARLRDCGRTWHRVGSLADAELANAVRTDGIDILIDMSGHTVMNRLLAFARKPAPVQATWLGYLGTTGLSTIDYRITDAHLDPTGTTERFHTEQLMRLPNASCYVPPSEAPDVGELPALHRGSVTFGSVNQWSKVTDQVRATWSRVLLAIPGSRLIVLIPGGRNPRLVDDIAARFTAHGVAASQIEVRPTMALREFMALFREIDIALDPFPYGGGTTTMHSLWMGVPVVSLAGDCAFARNAVGPLTESGLDTFLAHSPDEYVRRAVAAAADLPALRGVRLGLRRRLSASPLLDQARFARNMELAYQAMWRTYCSRPVVGA